MKVSEQWLRDWVNPPVDRATLVAQFTMAGLEVDSAEPVAAAFQGVVVAEVLTVAPHPDADRLRVCRVVVGEGEPLQIVCGAPNVRAGMRAPCACIGATLPEGLRIKRSKLRGVESQGMLCSANELGIGSGASGLLELPADAPVGVDLRNYLQLDDAILEVDLTPNRGDCLSVAGLAREMGVFNQLPVVGPVINPIPPALTDTFPVTVQASVACPRYAGRVIRNLDRRRPTPLWMQERLRRSGLRSLGPLVDVTNYVLLELGQPMHAFDLTRLAGGIVVRQATPGESLTLLDGTALTLDGDTLVIADEQRVVALAGIMGGADSAIGDDSQDVFLESAFFAPEAIVGRPRRYGLQTDSSYRFERGVDPSLQVTALERATQLLLEITGGQAGPVVTVQDVQHLPQPAVIRLRPARIRRLLGMDLDSSSVEDILGRLNMAVVAEGEGWQVTPPSSRFDVRIEADLIEELARVYGYHRLPQTRPLLAPAMDAPPLTIPQQAAQVLVARGYQEVITYSFVDGVRQGLLDPQHPPLALANPLSAELAVMRTQLWPGLIQAVSHNLNRQQNRIRFFEIGRTFVPTLQGLDQAMGVAGIALGSELPEQWGASRRGVDFFDVKGDVQALLVTVLGRTAAEISFIAAEHPALHPGQSAQLWRAGHPVGWLGMLHPGLEEQLALGAPAILFEIDFAALGTGTLPAFQAISRFPALRRDIAVQVDHGLSAQALLDCVRQAAGAPLQELVLFDVYERKDLDPGRKSVAMGLTLQDPTRTLTDDEVETVMAKVVAQLKAELGATLRDA